MDTLVWAVPISVGAVTFIVAWLMAPYVMYRELEESTDRTIEDLHKSAAQLVTQRREDGERAEQTLKDEIAKRDGQIAELQSTKAYLEELVEDFDRQSKPKLEIVGVREGSDDDSHIVQIRNVSRDDVQAYVLLTDITPPVRSAVLPIRLDYVHEYGSGGHKFLAPGEVANVDVLHSRDNERFQIHGGGGVIQLPRSNYTITLEARTPRADPVVRKFDIRLLPQGMVFFQENVESDENSEAAT